MLTIQTLVLYLGTAIACLVLVIGMICAGAVLVGQRDWAWRLLERVGPALGIMFTTTLVAALLLFVTRWFTGA